MWEDADETRVLTDGDGEVSRNLAKPPRVNSAGEQIGNVACGVWPPKNNGGAHPACHRVPGPGPEA